MKKDNCLFCKIVNNEVKAKIIDENKNAICFMDINPLSNGHCLVISKNHYDNLSSLKDKELKNIFKLIKEAANKLKNSELKPLGFNYLSNENEISGQEIFHFHMHIIPKYEKDNLIDINDVYDTLRK